MIENEITKLYKKIQELKTNYEIAKDRRTKIVEEMESLDTQISEYDNIQEEMAKKHKNYLMIKESIIKGIKKTLGTTACGIIILAIINVITKNFSMFIQQILYLLILNGGIYILPPLLIGLINHKMKKITIKDIMEKETEHKEILNKRIYKGMEYKKAREEEVIAEKIYKGLEPILTAQIIRMEQTGKECSNKQIININDIYYKIKLEPSFDNETIEKKKNILDEELRKYLSLKLSEMYYNAVKPEDLEILSTEELVKMLMNEIPFNQHNEALNPLIHAIINFSSNLQGYGIVWFEEKEESLIHTPEIIFDEQGRWTEFKTHKNTDYQIIFDTIYETFINKVMKQQISKSRIRK